MSYFLILAQALIATFFLVTAYMKLVRHPHMTEAFELFGLPYSVAIVAALVELVTGPLLLAGLFFPLLGALGAVIALPQMLVASLVNFRYRGPGVGIGVLIIIVLPLSIIVHQRQELLLDILRL